MSRAQPRMCCVPARCADSSQQRAAERVKQTLLSPGKRRCRGVVLQSTGRFPVVSQLLLSPISLKLQVQTIQDFRSLLILSIGSCWGWWGEMCKSY